VQTANDARHRLSTCGLRPPGASPSLLHSVGPAHGAHVIVRAKPVGFGSAALSDLGCVRCRCRYRRERDAMQVQVQTLAPLSPVIGRARMTLCYIGSTC